MSRRRSFLILAILALWVGNIRSQATATVCDSGCTYTNLQTAVDTIAAGDTLLTQEGKTYTLTLTLPVKAGAGSGARTKIRTGVNSTGTIQNVNRYPAAGFRICPSGFVQDWYDCSTRAPQDMTRITKITPASNDQPAIVTASTGSGTPVSYYDLQWLEFVANPHGGNADQGRE